MWIIPRAPAFITFLALCFLPTLFFQGIAQTTDSIEVEALNAIFREWNLSSSMSRLRWNTSGDLCSGFAVTADEKERDDDVNFNPAILCDCSYNNRSTCHIIRLKAYDLGIVGTIPNELKDLKYLNNLQIARNSLRGPLPAFIGNFTSMKYLSIGRNLFSGTIPKELGNLKNLISLGIGINNFSGSLPPEIGNLTNVEQMYLDSCGFSGVIPETFVKLRKLKILLASDNNFGGKVPDFLGHLTNLVVLMFQGNSFHGPIPSRYANLVEMRELILGDLSNGSSSLAFIRNMKSLRLLVLRNSKISGTIPSDMGDYKKLEYLDLSFNNLAGQLPPSLFNMDGLASLFLGNNNISGSLPKAKTTTLTTIDLSYNNLSGRFPSWVNEKDLLLNLVANNFIIDDSNRRILPQGLDCLQQDFPCNRDSPTWSSFAINCGGNESTTDPDGTVYDIDSQNLAAASYHVTSQRRWAVSNVGTYISPISPVNKTFVQFSSSLTSTPYTNILKKELFQTARSSPSSLRYYGLGLENGNYKVKLHFAEITLQESGRRIFDIYIQGIPVAKDFDIRTEADGKSFTAIERIYDANVTENFLEIHFFWAGKGTCCIPTTGTYGPSISAISVTPNFDPTDRNGPPSSTKELPSSKKNNKALIVGLVVGFAVICAFLVFKILTWSLKRLNQSINTDEELIGLAIKPNIFRFAELKTATEDFNPDNKVGEGGFGVVFKGKLLDGRMVAVKQLSVTSHQGKQQFITEIATISAVQHRNLVKLYGCCCEGDRRLLVYEYLENKSLDRAIFGKGDLHLPWPSRFAICLGTARALAYLHEESSIKVVHRDVKTSNILLDNDLNPKISDFGLAKLYDDKKTHISTRVAGTIGYLAPEYALRGRLTEKADVFGFGVVALEILTGRPNTDSSLGSEETYLLEWAWHLHECGTKLEMMDPTLSSYDEVEAIRVIGVALLCTQTSSALRPPMSQVVNMLTGDIEVREAISKPSYLIDLHFGDNNSGFASNTFSSGLVTVGTVGSQISMPFQVAPEARPTPRHSDCNPILRDLDAE